MQRWVPVAAIVNGGVISGTAWIATHPEAHAPWWLSLVLAIAGGASLAAITFFGRPAGAAADASVVDQAAQLGQGKQAGGG